MAEAPHPSGTLTRPLQSRVAQSAEQPAVNRLVGSSSLPPRATIEVRALIKVLSGPRPGNLGPHPYRPGPVARPAPPEWTRGVGCPGRQLETARSRPRPSRIPGRRSRRGDCSAPDPLLAARVLFGATRSFGAGPGSRSQLIVAMAGRTREIGDLVRCRGHRVHRRLVVSARRTTLVSPVPLDPAWARKDALLPTFGPEVGGGALRTPRLWWGSHARAGLVSPHPTRTPS